ncbi:down syndrome cell adhesion molecule-like protein Dscam2 [Nephila pilipes]|uniref:Down syndrome cell adhesion molecule-like protein Dscam2 n=1 Tax=Nephila pilipes TaxID=299642 RepID=A0A8X6P531_NEPPI|nr:down syndrome cell adhesion molecule-like protein Dscam2 [Nephila pilipes]
MDFQLRAPRFQHEPANRVEFSNSSGTVIACSAEGRPPPLIRWVKHDGEVLQDLPGLRYTRHDGSLVFPPFPSEEYRADVHASIYRCEASNRIGVIGSKDVHVRAGKSNLEFMNFLLSSLMKYSNSVK